MMRFNVREIAAHRLSCYLVGHGLLDGIARNGTEAVGTSTCQYGKQRGWMRLIAAVYYLDFGVCRRRSLNIAMT